VDKFTKWIEVKPATSITASKAVEFIREIMYRFGVSNNIITDNRTQFTARVGPFKKDKGGFTQIFVAVEKFTKWIEVKPATSITASKAVEFIREIMYQFGVSNNIITDNRTQFTAREFKDFCADICIKINYDSVSHS
jgi:malate synthase